MRYKVCARCKQEKSVRSFYRNGKYYQAYCKPCCKIVYREYAQKNAERLRLYGVKYATRNYELIAELKNRPCQDCDRAYPPYIMDFDHRPGSGKILKVSSMARSQYSEDLIRAEAAKCDVVCANCHRERTHQRKRGARDL